MVEFIERLEKGYKEYVASKLGKDRKPCNFMYVNEACKAAQTISCDYDLGIELATDGLVPGYVFHLHGFPTKAVRLARRGTGAIWQPIDDFGEEDIRGKGLILFDNDVVTGRTLRRAMKELGRFSPKYVDLLLMHEMTYLSVGNYKKWRRNNNVPAVEDSYTFTPLEIRETPNGIEVDYIRPDEDWTRTMELDDSRLLALRTRRNVPKEIRKTMTLQNDFKDDGMALVNLEGILRGA